MDWINRVTSEQTFYFFKSPWLPESLIFIFFTYYCYASYRLADLGTNLLI